MWQRDSAEGVGCGGVGADARGSFRLSGRFTQELLVPPSDCGALEYVAVSRSQSPSTLSTHIKTPTHPASYQQIDETLNYVLNHSPVDKTKSSPESKHLVQDVRDIIKTVDEAASADQFITKGSCQVGPKRDPRPRRGCSRCRHPPHGPQARHPKHGIEPTLNKKQDSEESFINAKLVDVDGTIGVKLVGMYFGKLRDIASLKGGVSDVVIAVPGWYTDIQRRAVLDAAAIANRHRPH
ncbi:hypothetical protein NMY22_g2551 [Coprinellus aureogranulatus]|nr:hypothetical protein NMY22_g2551 [Coprinellus aureogranulatus]